MKEKKLKILTNVLGTGYRTNNEHLFKCPYCDHHKRKFSVNLDKGYYKCWVCDTRGKNIYRVVRRFGTNHDKSQWRDFTSEIDFDQLEDLFAGKIEEKQILEMPEGFISLANREMPPTGFAAMNYLRQRGITKQDIVWWKMGYCSKGEYEGRIIIPSFDDEGDLSYLYRGLMIDPIILSIRTLRQAVILYSTICLWIGVRTLSWSKGYLMRLMQVVMRYLFSALR